MSKSLLIDDETTGERAKTEIIADRIGYLTRSLVKNNIVKQNAYIVLLVLEYMSMMYYIVRLADLESFNKAFGPLENLLDITMTDSHIQITSVSQATPEVQQKALDHMIINLATLACFTFFLLLFVNRLFKIKNFD